MIDKTLIILGENCDDVLLALFQTNHVTKRSFTGKILKHYSDYNFYDLTKLKTAVSEQTIFIQEKSHDRQSRWG